MSLAEIMSNYEPKENAEFGEKKELKGEAVARVVSLGKIMSKKEEEWILLKCEVIHPIEREGREDDNLEYGDEIVRFYNPMEVEQVQRLADDMFTAGIPLDTRSDEVLDDSMAAATDKLVYFRCWIGKWKDKNTGEERKAQNVKILSKNKITEENSTPAVPF